MQTIKSIVGMAVCALALALLSGIAYADMTPTTGVAVQVIIGATDVTTSQHQQFPPPNANAPSSASVSGGANGSDGSTAGGSAAAFADFGTLGVSGSGGGSTPPGNSRSVSSTSTLASAFWGDFLTAIPNPGSLLVPGAPVTATLTLDLHFDNSILAINNANGGFAYDLFAGIVSTDPVTGVQSSTTLFDDCFVLGDSVFDFCDVGSTRIGMPGNTDGPLTVQLAPVSLPLAILQPFELGVGLSMQGECNAGPNDTAISSCVSVRAPNDLNWSRLVRISTSGFVAEPKRIRVLSTVSKHSCTGTDSSSCSKTCRQPY